jgi:hypothetical protein
LANRNTRNIWTVAIAAVCEEDIALLNIAGWVKELECEVIAPSAAQHSDALAAGDAYANPEGGIAHKQNDSGVRLNALYDANETVFRDHSLINSDSIGRSGIECDCLGKGRGRSMANDASRDDLVTTTTSEIEYALQLLELTLNIFINECLGL